MFLQICSKICCEVQQTTDANITNGDVAVERVNTLWSDGDFCHRAGHRNCRKNLRLSKRTDMTIHWKALEEHFLMIS
jgi:hypothetical protein